MDHMDSNVHCIVFGKFTGIPNPPVTGGLSSQKAQ